MPDNGENLWNFTEQACKNATEYGAPFKEHHKDKAKIHTWLAWQNPPGRQLHNAIMERIFSPESPRAKDFIMWFQELFEVV